jgi:hypothetical protein
LSDTQKFYYTNEAITTINDERLFAQGQIYVAGGTSIASLFLGTIWMEWVVDLFDPQNEDDRSESFYDFLTINLAIPDDSATPNAAWTNVLDPNRTSPKIVWGTYLGTRGFKVPPGTWCVDQFIYAASAATSTSAAAISVADIRTGFLNSTIDSNINANAIILGNAINSSFFTAPAGGSYVWGNVSSAAGITATNFVVRVYEVFPEWF